MRVQGLARCGCEGSRDSTLWLCEGSRDSTMALWLVKSDGESSPDWTPFARVNSGGHCLNGDPTPAGMMSDDDDPMPTTSRR